MPRGRPKNVVALTPGGKITMEQVLGWLAMFTVPDQPISQAKLIRTWARHDLDTGLLPQKRVPVHRFQIACRSVETRKRENGGHEEVKVDEIYEDASACAYQVTRMVRDRSNNQITFEASMRVTFDKASATITVDPMDRDAYKALSGLEAAIREHMEQFSGTVPGQKVRAAVRHYMARLGGTNVRRKAGGVYFVPKHGENQDTLTRITGALEALYGGDAELWTVPLADDKTERQMVEKHFTMNIEEVVEEEIHKIAGVLQRDNYIRKDLMRNVIEQRKALGKKHEDYAELLGSSLKEVDAKLALLDEQVETLVARAQEKDDERTAAA